MMTFDQATEKFTSYIIDEWAESVIAIVKGI